MIPETKTTYLRDIFKSKAVMPYKKVQILYK